MLPMSEGHVFGRSANILMLDPLALVFPHVGESEWIEYVRVVVASFVVVRAFGCHCDERTGRYHGAVGERHIFQSLTDDRY